MHTKYMRYMRYGTLGLIRVTVLILSSNELVNMASMIDNVGTSEILLQSYMLMFITSEMFPALTILYGSIWDTLVSVIIEKLFFYKTCIRIEIDTVFLSESMGSSDNPMDGFYNPPESAGDPSPAPDNITPDPETPDNPDDNNKQDDKKEEVNNDNQNNTNNPNNEIIEDNQDNLDNVADEEVPTTPQNERVELPEEHTWAPKKVKRFLDPSDHTNPTPPYSHPNRSRNTGGPSSPSPFN